MMVFQSQHFKLHCLLLNFFVDTVLSIYALLSLSSRKWKANSWHSFSNTFCLRTPLVKKIARLSTRAWFTSFHMTFYWRFCGSCRKTCSRRFSLWGGFYPNRLLHNAALKFSPAANRGWYSLSFIFVSRPFLRSLTFDCTWNSRQVSQTKSGRWK